VNNLNQGWSVWERFFNHLEWNRRKDIWEETEKREKKTQRKV